MKTNKSKADVWAEVEGQLRIQLRILCVHPMPSELVETIIMAAKGAFEIGFAAGSLSGAEDISLIVNNALTPASHKRQA